MILIFIRRCHLVYVFSFCALVADPSASLLDRVLSLFQVEFQIPDLPLSAARVLPR